MYKETIIWLILFPFAFLIDTILSISTLFLYFIVPTDKMLGGRLNKWYIKKRLKRLLQDEKIFHNISTR